MKPHHIEGLKLIFLLGICGAVLLTHERGAEASLDVEDSTYQVAQNEVFTQETWHILPHPTIAHFTVDERGNAVGMTTTGIPFRQFTIENDTGIRVQRFEIQQHYHYVVEGLIVYTNKDLSRELALAYEERLTDVS